MSLVCVVGLVEKLYIYRLYSHTTTNFMMCLAVQQRQLFMYLTFGKDGVKCAKHA